MIEPLQEDVVDRYDRSPADVSVYRQMVRDLISELSGYSDLEKEIIEWDAAGRPSEDFERLRKAAWGFSETGAESLRHRLFSGFVTNQDKTDGYGADFLFDTAIHLGIPPLRAHEIMTRRDI